MTTKAKQYLTFTDRLEEVLKSEGKLCLPNVKHVEDPQEALNLLARTSFKLSNGVTTPYHFLIREFEAVPPSVQTKETTWYPRIFLNSGGMGGQFDGSGVILVGNYPKSKVYTFHMCEHEWDESGANHSRGWHPKVCTKCGFDASIDSGD